METYSYSKLKRFKECPASYFKHYLNGEKTMSHGVTEFGLFMHKIMEKYFKKELKLEDMKQYFEDNLWKNIHSSTILNMSADFSKDMYSTYKDGFEKYLEEFKGIAGLVSLDDVKAVEEYFEFLVDTGYMINGVIDLAFEDYEGNLIICDHKSKNKFKSKKECKEYARQLYLYAYAWNDMHGKYPKRLMFNMMRGKPVIIKFSEEDMNEALKWVDDTVKEIENTMVFEPNPDTFFCSNWCGLVRDELCEPLI